MKSRELHADIEIEVSKNNRGMRVMNIDYLLELRYQISRKLSFF